MALSSADFLTAIRDAFSNHCKAKGDIIRVGSRDKDMTLRELRILLLGQFMEIIEYYFRTTTNGDENLFTEEEIQNVIDHANRIMGTTLYTDFS